MVEVHASTGIPKVEPYLKEELLLGLLGFGGSVFSVQACSGSDPHADLRDELKWLSSSDRSRLTGLLSLGSFYQTIEGFCTGQQRCAASMSAMQLALAEGLAEVLSWYREAILEIKKRPDDRSGLFLAGLQVDLLRFQVLMPVLAELVSHVVKNDLRGAALLTAVSVRAAAATGDAAACMLRLQWHCRQPLCKRMLAWMLYGELIGRADEFFISYTAASGPAAGSQPPSSLALGLQSQVSKHADLKAFKVSLQQQQPGQSGSLPPGISHATAHQILSIGKVAWLRRKHASDKSSPQLAATDPGSSSDENMLSRAEAGKILTELMRADAFDAPKLSRFVAALWVQAAREMWGLLAAEGQLQKRLQALRAYCLASSGDLLTGFLQQARSLFAVLPGADANRQLPELWQQACDFSTAAHDPLASTFCPTMGRAQSQTSPSQGRQLYPPSYDAWDEICLTHSVEEPLNQVITDTALQSYSKVWQLLVRLKRADMALQEAWLVLKRANASSRRSLKGPPIALCMVHTRLAHCISSILRYVQTDVIETQTAKFWRDMKQVDSVNAAHKAHQLYVDTMTAHAFLDEGSIMGAVSSLLKLSRELHASVQHWGKAGTQAAPSEQLAAVDAAALHLLEKLRGMQNMSLARAPHAEVLIRSLELFVQNTSA